MKPVFAKILEGLENEIYATRLIERRYFTTEFHFHLECQLTYIVKGTGYKVVGDCVENFESGELTLLGAHIPHVWYNDPLPAAGQEDHDTVRSVALFFHPDKLTASLSSFFDVKKLESIFELAKRGMKFYGDTKIALKKLLLKTSEERPGPPKMILLLEMLQLLCTTGEYELLAGTGYVNTYTSGDSEKMDKVFKYVFSNFSSEISLEKAAALAHMNKQAFCRYFKSRTQKTFVDFVNEVRITQACKLIGGEKESIGTIAYLCGFNSLTNFNRFFKKIKKVTPREYRLKLVE